MAGGITSTKSVGRVPGAEMGGRRRFLAIDWEASAALNDVGCIRKLTRDFDRTAKFLLVGAL